MIYWSLLFRKNEDQKKTALSAEDIEHYKKIIAALKLTEELMAEIDLVVEF